MTSRLQIAPPSPRRGISAWLDRQSERRFALAVGAPGLLLIGLFVVPPVLIVFGMSFMRLELLKDDTATFVAFRNYAVRMSLDSEFFWTLPRTVLFSLAVTAVAVPVALGTAVLINGRGRLTGLLGLLLLLPWAVAPIADGVLWRQMFAPRQGLAAGLLDIVGLPRIVLTAWPGSLTATLVAVIWRSVPLLGVLFLGALRTVPRDLSHAARLDGATAWQTFRYVVLPAIAPTVIGACVLQVILTLETFDIQFAMTNASPPDGALLSGLSIFDTVIGSISLGYGAAQTVVLSLVIAGCLGVLWLLVRPRRPARTLARDADADDLAGRAPSRLILARPPARESASAAGRTMGGPGAAEHARAAAARAPIPARAPIAAGRSPVAARPLRPGALGRFGSAVGRPIGRLARVAVMVLVAAWLLGPIAWILITSTQSEYNLASFPPRLDTSLDLSGYRILIGDAAWRGAAVISVVISVGATALALIVALLAAYPLARFRLRGSRVILLALAGTQLIPPVALAIPLMWVIIRADLRNTVPGLVLVNAAFWAPILVWLVRGAFLAVPTNLEAAARIDGSSRLGALFRITLPTAAPAIAAAAAIAFVGIWNDFVFVALIGGRDTSTLPRYLGQSSAPPVHVLAAAIVMTVAPCIAVVVLIRRRILGSA